MSILSKRASLPVLLIALGALARPASAGLPIVTEVEPNDTTAQANVVSFGGQKIAILRGAISPNSDEDLYSVPVSPGDKVWVLVDTGGSETGADSTVEILDTNGNTLWFDDDGGNGNDSNCQPRYSLASGFSGVTAPVGPNVFLRVASFAGEETIASYKLWVVVSRPAGVPEVEPNDTTATATPLLTTGATLAIRTADLPPGSKTPDDRDVYTIVADQPGDVFFVAVNGDPDGNEAFRNVAITLLDVDGVRAIATFDSGAELENFTFIVPRAGTYYLQVDPGFGGAGRPEKAGRRRLGGVSSSITYDILAARIANTDPSCGVVDAILGEGSPQMPGISGTQTGRLNMAYPASNCGVPKTTPTLNTAVGARIFDSYSFTNPSSTATCVSITVDALGCGNPTPKRPDGQQGPPALQAVVYSPSYNAADPTAGWVADTGVSPQAISTMSFPMAAGATAVLVVHEVEPGSGCGAYRFVISPSCAADFGDAPDSYHTLFASNGARHSLGGPSLGANRDGEADGQPSAGADGDDLGSLDDEDGVTFGTLNQGATGSVTVVASGPGLVDAFIDFNQNGSFGDAGEKVLDSVAVSSGPNVLPVVVPAGATLGSTYARFRISTAGGLSFDGPAADGEVEDYPVTIAPPTCSLTCPANLTVTLTPGQCGAIVTYPAPTTTGSCATITCLPASGSLFAVGTTTVTCTAGGVPPVPSIALAPSCSFTVTVQGDDIQVSASAPPTAIGGASYTTSITVHANGPSASENVTLDLSVPSNARFVSLVPPAGWSCPVLPAPNGTGPIQCTKATMASGETSVLPLVLAPCGNLFCGESSVFLNGSVSSRCDSDGKANSFFTFTNVRRRNDLSLTLTGPPAAAAGGQATFTMVVSNGGPSDEANASLAGTLPSGWTVASATSSQGSCASATGTFTCSLGAIAAPGSCSGGATTATVTVVADVPLATPTASYTATASVTSGNCDPDPNLANNSATATVAVGLVSDLTLFKIGTPNPVAANRTLEYSLTVTNLGPSHGYQVQLVDNLPALARFQGLRQPLPPGWTCATPYPGTRGKVTCTSLDMPPGEITIGIKVWAPPVCDRSIIIVNYAEVRAVTADPTPLNNYAQVETLVTSKPCFDGFPGGGD